MCCTGSLTGDETECKNFSKKSYFLFKKCSSLLNRNEDFYQWIKAFDNREGRILEGAVMRH